MFYMAIFHSKPEYMASNENLGLQWSVESMINTLACLVFPYGQAEIAYSYNKNLPRIGMKIFENLHFHRSYTYYDPIFSFHFFYTYDDQTLNPIFLTVSTPNLAGLIFL